MDVLWFRLPKPERAGGPVVRGRRPHHAGPHARPARPRRLLAVRLPRSQGRLRGARGRPVSRRSAPIWRGCCPTAPTREALRSWDDVRVLSVRVDRLTRWHLPGLLFIGDAAHAMSPIGGVGINLAVQDAAAAARLLAGPLRERRGASSAPRPGAMAPAAAHRGHSAGAAADPDAGAQPDPGRRPTDRHTAGRCGSSTGTRSCRACRRGPSGSACCPSTPGAASGGGRAARSGGDVER